MATLLVTGSRNLDHRIHLTPIHRILTFAHDKYNFTKLVEGGATGADSIAFNWARARDIEIVTYPAEWEIHGRSAGPRRNMQMLVANPDAIVYAFPIGKSPGTRHCIKAAQTRGHVVEVFEMSL